MTTAETIFMAMTAGYAVIMFAVNLFQSIVIKRQKKLLNEFYSKLDECYTDNSELIKFCLSKILEDSIMKEDYETAVRCRELLRKYNDYERNKIL